MDNGTTLHTQKSVIASQKKLGWTGPLKDSLSNLLKAGLTAKLDRCLGSYPISKISKDGDATTLDDQLQCYPLSLWRLMGSQVCTRTGFTLHFTIYLKVSDFGLVLLITQSSTKLFWSKWVGLATQLHRLRHYPTRTWSIYMIHLKTVFPITKCITIAVSGN